MKKSDIRNAIFVVLITIVLIGFATTGYGFVLLPVLAALLFTWQGLSILFLSLMLGGFGGAGLAKLMKQRTGRGIFYGILFGLLASLGVLMVLLSHGLH